MFAREHVDPLFAQVGTRKQGRRYEFTNEAGDVSWFDLYSRGHADGWVGFDAGCAINPRSSVLFTRWSRREQGLPGPDSHLMAALWSAGVSAPPDVDHLGHWGFHDAAGAQRCCERLAAAITATVIPLLTMSMDRRRLVDAFAAGEISLHRMTGTIERTRVLLLVDDAPPDELNEALDALEASAADPRTREEDLRLLRWARQRRTRTD